MEEEIEIEPITYGKRKARSTSPQIEVLAKKRLLETRVNGEEYEPVTISTSFHRNSRFCDTQMKLQSKSKAVISDRRYFYGFGFSDFDTEYEKLKSVLDLVREKKEPLNPKKPSFSLEEMKRVQIVSLSNKNPNYSEISKELSISRQKARNWSLSYQKSKQLFGNTRGRKPKLNTEQIQFLIDLIDNPDNVGMTLKDMRFQLQKQFNLQAKELAISTIHRILQKNNKSFKKIIWKNPKNNEERTKELRKNSSIEILKALTSNMSIVYLDESSFNLTLRSEYGWGTKGKPIVSVRPLKSTNYSLLAAMDLTGVFGWMLFRGGIKKEDFYYFLMELVKKTTTEDGRTIVLFFYG